MLPLKRRVTRGREGHSRVSARSSHETDGLCKREVPWLAASFANRGKQSGDYLIARLRAEIAFAVQAQTDGVRFHVAVSDHEHGVNFHLLGAGDFSRVRNPSIDAPPLRQRRAGLLALG